MTLVVKSGIDDIVVFVPNVENWRDKHHHKNNLG